MPLPIPPPVVPPPIVQATPAPPRAPLTGTLLDRAINVPGIDWRVDGPAAARVRADTVPGHAAVRVEGAAARVTAPIARPVAAGTVLLVAVYARAPDQGLGHSVPVTIGVAAGDADAIAPTPVALGRGWKLWYAAGRTRADHPAGPTEVVVRLPGERPAVELGPVYVLDLGPGIDPASLPRN